MINNRHLLILVMLGLAKLMINSVFKLAYTKVFLSTIFLGLLTRNKSRRSTLREDVVLKNITINDSSLKVIVIFLKTDNNILVLLVF